MDRSSDLVDRTSSSRARLALMTLSNFTQHAEQSDSASWSPPASGVSSAAPRNRSQERPHEIGAPASHFARMTSRPFRGLPWAQGVAGSNPVAPTSFEDERWPIGGHRAGLPPFLCCLRQHAAPFHAGIGAVRPRTRARRRIPPVLRAGVPDGIDNRCTGRRTIAGGGVEDPNP